MLNLSGGALVRLEETDTRVDTPRVAIPCAELHIVARFGSSARRGLDLHAFGGHTRARRKIIRRGHRVVMARLRLGAHPAILGVSAAEIAGRTIPLEELWSDSAVRRLYDQLASAPHDAAEILERAIAERARPPQPSIALAAADRLTHASVREVATELGVSERHLRRVFHDLIGMNPKEYAKLARFHRALAAAKRESSWAAIAVAAGYFDQAHLISEFRTIAGVTPRQLLRELPLGLFIQR